MAFKFSSHFGFRVYIHCFLNKVLFIGDFQLSEINTRGCYEELEKDFNNNVSILGIIALSISCIEVTFLF